MDYNFRSFRYVYYGNCKDKSMSRLLIACSNFKDSLSSLEVCNSLSQGFLQHSPNLEISILPLSDGGEGFLSSINRSSLSQFLQIYKKQITGPLGEYIEGEYGILSSPTQTLGVIELARLSGIEFVPNSLRNPLNTTSHGTGELIQYLYSTGIREFLIGLGGSATTDGGLSVLYPLEAFEFEFDEENRGNYERPKFITGRDLNRIKSVRVSKRSNMAEDLKLTVACDVNNPMLGRLGSARVFGPQKGITEDMQEEYEEKMQKVCQVLKGIRGEDVGNKEFTGAAGGISGGLMAAFKSLSIKKGIDIISDLLNLPELVRNSDFIITGEGSYDSQTKGGKVVSKILELSPSAIIVCGINKCQEQPRVYDLVSRFGEASLTDTANCLKTIASEIYQREISCDRSNSK